MRTSLQDLIATCPNQLEANSIIVYDGCNWIVTEIPDGITCEDVLGCVDCEFILSLINFREGLIVDGCTISVSPERLNTNITATFDCNTGELVVGTTTMDLSCIADLFSFSFTDGLNTEVVNNGEQIFVQGLHGLQMVVGANLLQIDLPSGGTNGQVLTWNATSETAYRANITILCCDRVYDCMNPIVAGLQNQINIIAGQLCPCGGEGTPLSVYEEGLLVMGSVSMINIIGTCLTATANIGTNHMVDITLDISATFDDQTNTLTICGTDVDLSPLARTGFGVYQDETPVSLTQNINFNDYLMATRNAVTSMVDVSVNIPVTFSGCEGLTPYQLSIGGVVVDLSCLTDVGCPCPIEVDQETFVMENGNDSTGVIGRFDLPFRTLRAAVLAGAKNIIMYAGNYSEINDIIINNVSVTIFAHPNVNFVGSFDMRGNTASLKIDGEMNWLTPANTHPIFSPYVIMGNVDGTSPVGYNVNINVNRIDLSGYTLLHNVSNSPNIAFNFVSKKSYKKWISIGQGLFIINSKDYTERLLTRQINVSLGYFSIFMSAADTVEEYTPFVRIINSGNNNNIRLFDTTLQEDKQSIDGAATMSFGGAIGVRSKCGQIQNIIREGSYVEVDRFNIVGKFTASGYGEETPTNALFQLSSDNDVDFARLMVRNCNWSFTKTREVGRTYAFFRVETQTAEQDSYGLVEFDGNNTFFVNPADTQEFEYSLTAPDDVDNTYIGYYSTTGFMVTNKVFEALALTATNHTHGGYKHIICTADEPYSTLFEPIIHIDHSL